MTRSSHERVPRATYHRTFEALGIMGRNSSATWQEMNSSHSVDAPGTGTATSFISLHFSVSHLSCHETRPKNLICRIVLFRCCALPSTLSRDRRTGTLARINSVQFGKCDHMMRAAGHAKDEYRRKTLNSSLQTGARTERKRTNRIQCGAHSRACRLPHTTQQ